MKAINSMFYLRAHKFRGKGEGMFKMVLNLVFYVSIVKHQLYDCKNWGTEITAVPAESLQTMVIARQTQLVFSVTVRRGFNIQYNSEIPIVYAHNGLHT